MIVEAKKALPVWLILLCVVLVSGSLGQASRQITDVRKIYEPLFTEYPSLPRTVLIYQSVVFASICAALFTVLQIYRRTPKSLSAIQNGLLLTVGLRVFTFWVFPLMAGLPSDALNPPYPRRIISSIALLVIGTAWFLYLARSKSVHEIYSA